MLNLNETSKEYDLLEKSCEEEEVDVSTVKEMIDTVNDLCSKKQEGRLEEKIQEIIEKN